MLIARFPRVIPLSRLMTILMLVTACAGILLPDVYQEPGSGKGFSKAYWLANDLVTLLVACPVTLITNHLAARGSRRAELIWLGTVGYVLYNYLFYLFGATLNWFFPLYIALVIAAVSILLPVPGYLIARAGDPLATLPRRTRLWVSVYMAIVAMIVTVTWTGLWRSEVTAGTAATDYGEFVRTVAAVDIPLLAATMATGAWGMWRRRWWGPAVAVIVNVGTALYMVVLAGTQVSAALAGVEGAVPEMPKWVVLAVASLAAAWHVVRQDGMPSQVSDASEA